MCTRLCLASFNCGYDINYPHVTVLPTFFSVALPTLGQSYDCFVGDVVPNFQGPSHISPARAWSGVSVIFESADSGRRHYCVIYNIVLFNVALYWEHIDGLVQDCGGSSALAMELLRSCTKPSISCILGISQCARVLSCNVVLVVPESVMWTKGMWPWWRHQMEIFSTSLALCAGNSPVTGEFPTQRPVTRSFDAFFDMARINAWANNR